MRVFRRRKKETGDGDERRIGQAGVIDLRRTGITSPSSILDPDDQGEGIFLIGRNLLSCHNQWLIPDLMRGVGIRNFTCKCENFFQMTIMVFINGQMEDRDEELTYVPDRQHYRQYVCLTVWGRGWEQYIATYMASTKK